MHPGALASGRYRASKAAGEDALGELWSGVDTWTGDPVSVRVLHRWLTPDPARLRWVGEQLRRLRWDSSSPHLALALDHDLRGFGGRAPYVVFAASGEPLSERLDREGPMSVRVALEVLGPVADALAAAHATWIAHGALSPASVLMRDDGLVAVIDVGLGELLPERDDERPRSAGANRFDRSSEDVFALAQLFDRLVTGEARDSSEREGPLSWEAQVPHEVGGVLRRAWSPYPGFRPEMSELAAALTERRAGSTSPATPPRGGPVVPHPAQVAVDATRPPAHPRRAPQAPEPVRSGWWRRHRRLAVALGSTVVVGGGALWGVLARDDWQDRITPARSPAVPSTASPGIRIVPTTVPNILGRTVDRASARLERSGLVVGDITMVAGRSGVVVRSEPTQGEAVIAGTTVDLFVGNRLEG